MNILVGVDGTERSLVALRFVASLVSEQTDRIHLYFAPPRRSWTSYLEVPSEARHRMIEAFARDVIQQARAAIPTPLQGKSVSEPQPVSPAQGLLQTAAETGADLIVVGAGRSSQRLRYFVGGVARKVIHEADRPVLACRPTARTSGPRRILLAVDPNEPWQATVELLGQLHWPKGSVGRIVHVIDYVEDERLRNWIIDSDSDVATIWTEAYDQELSGERSRVLESLKNYQQKLPTVFQGHEPLIAIGHVVEQLVKLVESEQADLVVVGGQQRGRLSRWLGSTTEGLLLQANASILVVHPERNE